MPFNGNILQQNLHLLGGATIIIAAYSAKFCLKFVALQGATIYDVA